MAIAAVATIGFEMDAIRMMVLRRSGEPKPSSPPT